MSRFSAVRSVTVLGLVGLIVAACATGTGHGTVKSVTAADLPALAGVWQGSMTGTGGGSFPATLNVNPDGTYVLRGGAITAQGKAEAKDGQVEFVSTATSGVGAIGQRTGSAVVMDRGDTWGLVGSGRAPAGPYNFEFSKVK